MTTIILVLVAANVMIFGVRQVLASPAAKPTGMSWSDRKRGELRLMLKAERKKSALLRRHVRHLRRALRHRPSSMEAIRLSAIVNHVDLGSMIAVARCETGGSFNPRSENSSSSASGLFQFLDSTWAHTPFRGEDVYSPYANALAAGWLWRADGGSWREWSCQP